MNSSYNFTSTNHGRGFNPAYVHPDELRIRDLEEGDEVRLISERSSIPAIVMADENLRMGIVSMTHSYGKLPDEDPRFREIGSGTGRLLFDDEHFDRYSGQPLMSNVAVKIERIGAVSLAEDLVK